MLGREHGGHATYDELKEAWGSGDHAVPKRILSVHVVKLLVL